MKAADVMTRDPVTTGPEAALQEAASLMVSHRISGLPVIEAGGTLVGMITEGDLLRRVELGTAGPPAGWLAALLAPGRAVSDYVRTHSNKVRDVMTAQVISITPETPLAEVVALMQAHQVKRFPVLQSSRLVGIVSRADLLRALVQLLPERYVATLSDAELRKRLLAEIDRQHWAPRSSINVTVENGVVELQGAITDDRERAGLRVIAENTPGVRGVRDRLVWIEPLSGTVIDPPRP